MSSVEESCSNGKRKDYISWEDYFMGIAFLAAQRSKDPDRQVGSCIVNEDRKIVGIGYNGFPRGCSDDDFPWSKNKEMKLLCKLTYVCHAEMNAIMNSNHMDTKGCTLYVTLFPCNECAKIIIQAGIKTVVYSTLKSNNKTKAAIRMFEAARINFRLFKPMKRKIEIYFEGSPDNDNSTNGGSGVVPSPPKQTRRDETAEDEAKKMKRL